MQYFQAFHVEAVLKHISAAYELFWHTFHGLSSFRGNNVCNRKSATYYTCFKYEHKHLPSYFTDRSLSPRVVSSVARFRLGSHNLKWREIDSLVSLGQIGFVSGAVQRTARCYIAL
jgi:hypothetical protein